MWLTEMDEAAVVGRAQAAYVRAAAGGAAAGWEHAAGCMVAASSERSVASSDTTAAAPQASRLASSWTGRMLGYGGRPAAAAPAAAGTACGCTGTAVAAAAQQISSSGGDSNKFASYLNSVRGALPLGELAPHLREGAVRNVQHRASLSRFRCSCHDLRVERDRYLPKAVKPARHLRTCLLCGSSSVEDEYHMIFSCPLYSSIRFQFADLFSTTCHTLDSFLSQSQDKVARFI